MCNEIGNIIKITNPETLGYGHDDEYDEHY